MSRKRVKKTYRKVESNIREVTYVFDDGTTQVAGYEVRVGQTRASGLVKGIKDAQRIRNEALTSHGKGAYVAPSAGAHTLSSVVDLWLAGDQVAELKPSTRLRYEGVAKNGLVSLHPLKVNKISVATVKMFRADLIKKGSSPLTVKKVMSVLSFVLDTAVDEGMIAVNPCLSARPRRRAQAAPKTKIGIPEMEQVEELLTALANLDHPKAGEWSLYAEVAAYAGLRSGEVAGLRVRAIDPLHRSIRVEETVAPDDQGKPAPGTPKSAESNRTVTELPADLCSRLAAHVAGRAVDDYVFGDGTTPMRHPNYYRRVFKPTAAAVGLPNLRFHDLRHFYASDLLRDPHLSVKDVAARLGHADASLVLRTYGHLFADAGAGLGDRVAERRAAARAKAQQSNVSPLAKVGH